MVKKRGEKEKKKKKKKKKKKNESSIAAVYFWFPFGTSLFNLSTSTSLPPRKPNQTTDKASSPSTAASSGPTA